LGGAQLGFDVFAERAIYTSTTEQIVGGITTETKIKGRFINPGLLASLHLEILRIALGISVPITRMTYSQETTGAAAVEAEAKSTASFAGNIAAELPLELLDLDWTLGVRANMVMYSGEYAPPTPAPTVEYPDYLLLIPALYGGFTNEISEHAVLLALCASIGYGINRTKPTNITAAPGGGKTTNNFLFWTFNAGLEKTWDDLNRLDAIYTRAGLTYGGSIAVSREDGELAGDEYHARIRAAAARTGFGLPLGVGIAKSIFGLDIQINPAVLINTFKLVNGTFAANDFAKATLTVDFGGNILSGSSSSSSSSVAPSYEAAPAPTYETETETEEETDVETTPAPADFEF
jgi:hypothetical protein